MDHTRHEDWQMRKIVLAGGSGFLGKVLQRHFTQLGDQVCVLSRGKAEGQDVKMVEWTGDTAGPWINELEGADILINLAEELLIVATTTRTRKRFMTLD